MATKSTAYPAESTAYAPFSFEITKVVRETVRPKLGGESSIGELIDTYLENAAIEGAEVQSVKLSIDEDQWFAMVEVFKTKGNRQY